MSLRAPLVAAPTAPTAPHRPTQSPPQHPRYPRGGMWRSRAAPALRLPFAESPGQHGSLLKEINPDGYTTKIAPEARQRGREVMGGAGGHQASPGPTLGESCLRPSRLRKSHWPFLSFFFFCHFLN